MPLWNNNNSDRLISLKSAVFWIAFDGYAGPTEEHIRVFNQEAEKQAHGGDIHLFGGRSPEGLRADAEENAWKDLRKALFGGDITAKGRFSNRKARLQWAVANPDDAWEMHGVHPVPVAIDHWGAGHSDWREGVLTFDQGQYVGMGVPEFILRCLWPDPSLISDQETLVGRWQANRPALRSAPTEYLQLINKAVDKFWVDGKAPTVRKPKIVEWLKGHEVEGQPVSENLAQAIGTMILPIKLRQGGIEKLKWNRANPPPDQHPTHRK